MRIMQGFTLVELIITLAVAAILLSLAVPSFSTMIMNNRATADTNELLADINYARSEAVKRGSPVGICRTNNPTAGNPCTQGTSFADGWIVYDAEDGINQPDTAADILKIHGPIDTSNNASLGPRDDGGSTADRLVYTASGRPPAIGISIYRCDERGFSDAKAIIVAPSGRARVVHPKTEPASDRVQNGECPQD